MVADLLHPCVTLKFATAAKFVSKNKILFLSLTYYIMLICQMQNQESGTFSALRKLKTEPLFWEMQYVLCLCCSSAVKHDEDQSLYMLNKEEKNNFTFQPSVIHKHS